MNSKKVIVLGIDGMDPKMTKRLVDEGKLPHLKKMIELGSARKDLVMLGAQPTITPPMWTTLSTGAYPMTHGVTCYWNSHPSDIGKIVNNFNSAQVKAEQIWECTVKADKKTLVWTWPCSWPPISDSDNLHIVGGLVPLGPNAGVSVVEDEHITYASAECKEIRNRLHVESKGGAGCVMTEDMKESNAAFAPQSRSDLLKSMTEVSVGDGDWQETAREAASGKTPDAWLLLDHLEGEENGETDRPCFNFDSPIKEPKNWGHELPDGAKEFTVIVSKGLKRYPALLLKNEGGEYNEVEIYGSKKDEKPFVAIKEGEFYPLVITDVITGEEKVETTRHFAILRIDHEGKFVTISAGSALDIETGRKDFNWSPQSLYQQTIEIAGLVPCAVALGGGYPEMISRRSLPSWDVFNKWQAKALLGLIEANEYEAVFTHNHACDHIGHPCWRWAKTRAKYGYNDEKVYQGFLEEIYCQVDEYIGEFLPLIDKGWAIIVTSDHGLLCSEEDELPFLGEGFVMNIGVLRDLGYTVMKKDANGNDIRGIDWTKTKAVAPRGNHIYINLKGRNPYGSVEPADKYELERKIIDDLYSYRLDGKRIVNIALRNKDAAVLGMSGPECGDIIYFLEEGFNRLHGDALSTTEGYFGTSVSPIFIAAGAGIKKGCETERVIREVDVAPTVATLMNIDMPAQCEGAPVYQILEK